VSLAFLTPAAIGERVIPNWRAPVHITFLNQALVKAALTPNERLIVSIPPRHGKSTMISRLLPAWYLSIRPDHRVLLASYQADFAAQWGRAVRDIIEAEPELGITVRADSSAANRWDLEGHEGGMQTAGVGGAITGKGADLMLIDDPVKNDEQANSETFREKTWDWWQGTALNRQQPDASYIVVMTRWHEDDLAGRLIAHGQETGDTWRQITLPALAEEDDVLGRELGAPLWPEQYDAEALGRLERGMGSHWWAALYQQRPQPAGGTLFKRKNFRQWTEETEEVPGKRGAMIPMDFYVLDSPTGKRKVLVKDCWRFATVDVAASMKETADYTVVSCWAATPHGDLLLLDVYRGRYEGPDQVPLLRQAHDRYNLGYLGVESVAYQLTLIQGAQRAGLPIRPLKADKDKLSRALSAASLYEAGAIYHPVSAHWLGEWESELLMFPNGAHDDQVDTVAYAAGEIMRGNFAEVEHAPSIWV